jgi:hypothetical protein
MIRDSRSVTSIFLRHTLVAVVACLVSTEGYLGATDRPNGVRGEGMVSAELHKLVQQMAVAIGPRSYRDHASLDATADFMANRLAASDYHVTEQPYQAGDLSVRNIIAERRGLEEPDRVIVVGAHYDTVVGSPGADDNASGVAVLLELARIHENTRFRKTVRFVGFTLEEPPFFRSRHMGSQVYARALKERGERVEAMLCLESVGYYSQEPGTQSFPWPGFWLRWRYPTTGNFLTIVSNADSRTLQDHIRDALTKWMALPVETYTGSGWIPGVDWSDHGSFWNEDYPAVMLTDTALFRNPHYHRSTDLPDTLDYHAMTELVKGLGHVLTSLDEQR